MVNGLFANWMLNLSEEDVGTYVGSCHCGLVKFRLKTDIGYSVRCDCSICKKRGTIMVRCDVNDLDIFEGKEHLSRYQFNTEIAEHYFCSRCGIYTFHKMRKLPDKFGVNAGCLEGVDVFTLKPIFIEGSKR